MRTLTFLFGIGFLFLFYPEVNAQQVISSAGVSGSNANGSISSTVGELVIDTKTAGSTTITQGFHQTKLTVTAIQELKGLDFSITAFPNPTNDFVTIKIEDGKPSKMTYSLFDSNGKSIQNGTLIDNEAEISFISLNPATYILKIMKNGKEIKTLKIVKQ
jgi:hypothetical protein